MIVRRRNLGARWLPFLGALILVLGKTVAGFEGASRHPVYVGVKVCAECHDGDAMGNQCSIWARSRHADAYAALSKPEARQIAKLSGVPVPPQQSPLCLGCHATAAEAEPWERDPTFAIQDGVQCEHCHGPGSEYADAAVMMNRELAMKRGLRLPSREECLSCHAPKGSHDAVLKAERLDMDVAWEQIKHPTPENAEFTKPAFPPFPTSPKEPAFVGAATCAECHEGPEKQDHFSSWRRSSHADAFAVLATTKAREIATEMGVHGDPRTKLECLKCHTSVYYRPASHVLGTASVYEGVSCEACHGPGSQHAETHTRPQAPHKNGLLKVDAATCLNCHENAHGKPFRLPENLAEASHPARQQQQKEEEPQYKTPVNLAVHPNGKELYAACEAAKSVIIVDLVSLSAVAEIPVGAQPHDVAFTPDGKTAFVSNRLDDTVSVIDTATRRVTATIPVGDEPHGLVVDREGRFLYVLNTLSEDISVIDIGTRTEVKRLAAGRGPWSAALSGDGQWIACTNVLSHFVPFRTPSRSEVTVIDAQRGMVALRAMVPGANGLRGIAWHPSGDFALFTLTRHKNLVPMTRVLQGWTITNGLGILWRDGRIDQVLLDEPGIAFPDPTDVVTTEDGKYALVTSAASNRVAVVAVDRLLKILASADDTERSQVLPNHLGKASEFVLRWIETPVCPRGIAIAPRGDRAFVAASLDDRIAVIDLKSFQTAGIVDLGGPPVITKERLGERVFHSAANTFQRQFACSSCHPDGHVEGLTYDIEPDGIGVNPVDNRTLRGILDTAPFKWEGLNPSLSRQCGPRLAVFFTRVHPFTPEQLSALDYYICTIPSPPNRHRPFGAELTPAQRRGKEIFYRTMTNDGRLIPMEQRCSTCHYPPLYTDRRLHDVGTKMPLDEHGLFDTPQLLNVYNSAPYLHNGIAETLEEIWTRFNPYDQHGVTNDMTKDQLNDLIEYLRTL